MRKCFVTILVLSVFTGISISPVKGQEFNVKQILEANESSEGSSNIGILEELKILICRLDSLLAEVEVPVASKWKRDLFKPLVKVRTGTGNGIQIINEPDMGAIPLVLTGTVLSEGDALAIFGKYVVGISDLLDGYRIISIETGKVVVESENGRRETLTINGEK